MKFGIVLNCYNSIDYLEKCLEPWIKRRKENEDILISCVDAKFQDYSGSPHSTDGTIELLEKYKRDNKIDYFQLVRPDLTEHDSRNVGLQSFKDNIDYLWLLDSDEIYTQEEISKVINFVKNNSFIHVFHIYFKNLVFDEKHYIEGFCPRRIWKVKDNSYKLLGFNYDNDSIYIRNQDNKIIQDIDLSTLTIPKLMCNPLHYTWLDNERSKKKVMYQNSRKGWRCSFKIQDGHLKLDDDYYKSTGQSLPEILEVK